LKIECPSEALSLLKETATAKFPEAAEAHIHWELTQVHRSTAADNGGFAQRDRSELVAVISRGEKVTEATNAVLT